MANTTKKTQFQKDHPVTVRSTIPNVHYISPPNRGHVYFILKGIGETEDITYGDLQEIRTVARSLLTTPCLVVDDPDIRASMPELEIAYNKHNMIDNLDWLTKGSEATAIKNINSVDKTLGPVFVQKVTDMFLAGKIKSYKILKAIEAKYGISFDTIEKDRGSPGKDEETDDAK